MYSNISYFSTFLNLYNSYQFNNINSIQCSFNRSEFRLYEFCVNDNEYAIDISADMTSVGNISHRDISHNKEARDYFKPLRDQFLTGTGESVSFKDISPYLPFSTLTMKKWTSPFKELSNLVFPISRPSRPLAVATGTVKRQQQPSVTEAQMTLPVEAAFEFSKSDFKQEAKKGLTISEIINAAKELSDKSKECVFSFYYTFE